MDKEATPFAVIRDGVVTQMADHAGAGLPDHLSFSQYAAGLSGPRREIAQALCQLLTAGAAFDLEISVPRLPTVVAFQYQELNRFQDNWRWRKEFEVGGNGGA